LFFNSANCCFLFFFTSNDLVVGFLSDDTIYLLQAELFSPWHTEKSAVVNFVREENRFPPLYPLLLGIIGVDSDTPILASIITISFLILSILLISCWTKKESRDGMVSILVPLLVAFIPSTLVLSQGLWSEFLFMCFLYGAFICLFRNNDSSEY